jgi:dTDP-4-amino-4,6-dideoxygalactose transaminase
MDRLIEYKIYPRRYFYPSLNTVSVFESQQSLVVSEHIARTVLRRPLYDALSNQEPGVKTPGKRMVELISPVGAALLNEDL